MKKPISSMPFFLPPSSQPKPTAGPLPVRAQLGKEWGSQQWKSKTLGKRHVFRSSELDGSQPKLLEDLVRPLSIFIPRKGKKEDFGKLFASQRRLSQWEDQGAQQQQQSAREGKPRLTCPIACCDKVTGSVGQGRAVGVIHLNLYMAFATTFPSLPLWKEKQHGLDKQAV